MALRRLFGLDAHGGASAVYPLAAEMATRLCTALQRGTVAPSAEPELRRVTAATMDEVGWLAYDAGQSEAARHWWLETSHLANFAEVPEAHVATLATMALQASTDPARTAVQRAGVISGSQRTTARLRHTVTLLGKQNYAPAREFAGAARRLLTT